MGNNLGLYFLFCFIFNYDNCKMNKKIKNEISKGKNVIIKSSKEIGPNS